MIFKESFDKLFDEWIFYLSEERKDILLKKLIYKLILSEEVRLGRNEDTWEVELFDKNSGENF